MLWKSRCRTCGSLFYAKIKLKGCVVCGSLRLLGHPTFFDDFFQVVDIMHSQNGDCLAKVNMTLNAVH